MKNYYEDTMMVNDENCEETFYTDSFRTYMKDISRYPLLSKDEELLLARKIKEGDLVAKERFINSNLRLVVSIAKQYVDKSEFSLMDLIQYGNMGLLRAVDKYDPEKGYAFSTYGVWWIRQDITRAISDFGGAIHIPLHKNNDANKLRRLIDKYAREYNREPSACEMARELGISEEKLQAVLDAMPVIVSMYKTIGENEDCEMADVLADEREDASPEKCAIQKGLRNTCLKMMDKLSEKEATVLKLRFGFEGYEWTLDEVGQLLDITRERVRQIEKAALKALATPKNKRLLYDYAC